MKLQFVISQIAGQKANLTFDTPININTIMELNMNTQSLWSKTVSIPQRLPLAGDIKPRSL